MSGTVKHGHGVGRSVLLLSVAVFAFAGLVVSASARASVVAWRLEVQPQSTVFSSGDQTECTSTKAFRPCDAVMVSVENVGGTESSESSPLTLVDHLPAGYSIATAPESFGPWSCGGGSTVTCSYGEPVAPGRYAQALVIHVNAPSDDAEATGVNTTRVEGGGAIAPVEHRITIRSNGPTPAFGFNEVQFAPEEETGSVSVGAAKHPWSLTAGFFVPTIHTVAKGTGQSSDSFEKDFEPVRNLRTVQFELPFGMSGNPQATGQCTEAELDEGGPDEFTSCPKGSIVGSVAIEAGASEYGQLAVSGEAGVSPVFNMKPQRGYPAELAFKYDEAVPVYMYASVIRAPSGVAGVPSGYRLRLVAAGIPTAIEVEGVALTIFGQTATLDADGHQEAFLTNPDECGVPETARVEMEAWTLPGQTQEHEQAAYPALTGCDALGFSPSLSFLPAPAGPEGGTGQADEPSGYDATVTLPQTTGFEEAATSDIRNAVVTLPAGVSLNPAAGQGLAGCEATGPEGINLGSESFGHFGQDLGDPEATELGAGHPGGNSSPYDDEVYHTAPGQCPESSVIGTAEIATPLLAEPLKGRVFVATPKCGGTGQPECTTASATNGELYGAYLEVAGEGVIVKLASTLTVNPSTGQITASFRENPELPVSSVKIDLRGGPRAALANPQTCGTASTTGLFEPWSSTTQAQTSSVFPVTGCAASEPFDPGFVAGTEWAAAGAFSPFSVTFSRQDGEQDLAGVQVRTPPGFAAMLSSVGLCGEPQAAQGTCPASSLIGTVNAAAGAGSSPLWLTGQAYLTGPYDGAPFGLSIVIPAKAGPFNLGDVVERAAITVDPSTAAVTITSGGLTQIKDGIPIRLRTVSISVNRPGFTFNPTSCVQQSVTGTITATQGAKANVSTPFAATGCAGLPFKPTLTASTQGKTSKLGGASLSVKVTSHAGEANIHKVELTIPNLLPTRQTTLEQACTEAQFNTNPAGCPPGSFIGTGVARTPVLSVPLEGPAIFVSHAGAAFPHVEFVLQGEGVTVVLDGKTDIKKGITYSRFETVPDAPVTSFETILPEGPHSIFTAYGNLCAPTTTKTVTVTKLVRERIHGHTRTITKKVKQTKKVPAPLTIPATLIGQNGAQITQNTKVTVTGCPKPATKAARAATAKRASAKRRSK